MATLTHILFASFAIVLLQGTFVEAHRKYNGTFESPAGSVDQKIKDIHHTNKGHDLSKGSAVKEETNHDQGLETVGQPSSILSDPIERVRRSGEKTFRGQWIHTIKRGKRSPDYTGDEAQIDLTRARRHVIDQGNRVVVDRSKKVIKKRSDDCDMIHKANELAAEELAKENTEERYEIDLRSMGFASKAKREGAENVNRGKRSPNIFESVQAAKHNNNVAKLNMDPTKRRGKRSPNVFDSVKAALDIVGKNGIRRGKRSPIDFTSLTLKGALENIAKRGKRSPYDFSSLTVKGALDKLARRGKRSPVSPSVQAAMDSASKHFRGRGKRSPNLFTSVQAGIDKATQAVREARERANRGKRSLDAFPPMKSPYFLSTILSEMETDLKQVHKDVKRDQSFANEHSTVNDMSLVDELKLSEDENNSKRFRRSPDWVSALKETMEKVKQRVNHGYRSADVSFSMNTSSDENNSFSDERNIDTLRKRRSPINLPPNIAEILVKAARDHANRG